MLNTRETASIVLLVPALVFLSIWLLRDRNVRESVWGLVRVLFTAPVLLLGAAGFYLYLAGVVWLASRVGLWNSGLSKETGLWFAVSGLGMLLSIDKVRKSPDYLWTAIRHVFAATVLIELFFQLQTFPLPVEVVAQLVITALFIMEFSVRNATKQGADSERVAGCLSQIIATVGLVFLAATAVLVVKNWEQVDWSQQGLTLAMLIWLPLAALPYVFLCARLMYGPRRLS